MYNCGVCGGIIEELGEMAVSSGGCVCAQKKAEESANSLQQLKAKILTLYKEYSGKHSTLPDYELYYVMEDLLSELKELSAI